MCVFRCVLFFCVFIFFLFFWRLSLFFMDLYNQIIIANPLCLYSMISFFACEFSEWVGEKKKVFVWFFGAWTWSCWVFFSAFHFFFGKWCTLIVKKKTRRRGKGKEKKKALRFLNGADQEGVLKMVWREPQKYAKSTFVDLDKQIKISNVRFLHYSPISIYKKKR